MEKFRIYEAIGKGGYSTVYKALNQENNQQVAIKAIKINSSTSHLQKIINRQVKLLYLCNQHPKIIKLYEVFRKDSVVYLIFEYIPMNLLTFYKKRAAKKQPLNQKEVIDIIKQVCDALNFLHSKGIAHRDLKPQNILIDPHTLKIKLTDFGFAKKMGDQQQTKYIVTRWYRPLQIILEFPYDKSVDIFSLGCIFLELLLSKEIFRSQSSLHQLSLICLICGFPKDPNFIKRIEKLGLKSSHFPKALIFEIVQKIPSKLTQLIIKMMSSTPNQRPTIEEILNNKNFQQNVKLFPQNLERSQRLKQLIAYSRQKSMSNSKQPKHKQNISKSHIISSSAIYKKNQIKKTQDQPINLSFQNHSTIIKSKVRKNHYLSSRQRIERSLHLSKQLKKLENEITDKYKKLKNDFNIDRKSLAKDYSYVKRGNAIDRSINESFLSRASTYNSKSRHKRQVL